MSLKKVGDFRYEFWMSKCPIGCQKHVLVHNVFYTWVYFIILIVQNMVLNKIEIMFKLKKKFIFKILYSERSDKCIDFTNICFFCV